MVLVPYIVLHIGLKIGFHAVLRQFGDICVLALSGRWDGSVGGLWTV